jgi:hypothetical protein
MRFRNIVRPLNVVVNLWCRVLVVGPDHTALSRHQLSGPGLPDIGAVDNVARLVLQAGRVGGRIILSDVSPALRALLNLAGLGVEMEWESEGGEEALGVEGGKEKLHTGDLSS